MQLQETAVAPEKIVVAMSGGVDSSVSAWLLACRGFEVTGLFMKNWEEDDDAAYCAAAEDRREAEAVCDKLGIALHTVNFAHEYWERVFQVFLDESARGLSPNPDVLCNREIKFGEFMVRAAALGAAHIATGHYARRRETGDGWELLRGADPAKDQSYFLHAIDQQALAAASFPVGGMCKAGVRALAREAGLANHDRKDSTGICFIGERNFKDFLARYLPPRPGEIRALDGAVLGLHQGVMYYTLGQRHGLNIGGRGEPWYVVAKDVAGEVLYVAQGHDHPALFSSVAVTGRTSWIDGRPPQRPFLCRAQSRYRQQAQPCKVTPGGDGDGVVTVRFETPQRAVTPGQYLVFYRDEVCLGGGVIERTDAAVHGACAASPAEHSMIA